MSKPKAVHKQEITRYAIEEKVGKRKWDFLLGKDVLSSAVSEFGKLDDGTREVRLVKEKVKVTYKTDGLNKKIISEEVIKRRVMDC